MNSGSGVAREKFFTGSLQEAQQCAAVGKIRISNKNLGCSSTKP